MTMNSNLSHPAGSLKTTRVSASPRKPWGAFHSPGSTAFAALDFPVQVELCFFQVLYSIPLLVAAKDILKHIPEAEIHVLGNIQAFYPGGMARIMLRMFYRLVHYSPLKYKKAPAPGKGRAFLIVVYLERSLLWFGTA